MRSAFSWDAVILTALAISGCTTETPAPESSSDNLMCDDCIIHAAPAVDHPAIPLEDLVGKWDLREYVTEGGLVTPADDTRARLLIFPSGRLIDRSICDQFDGDYVAADGEVRLENQITGPIRACYSPIGSGRMWAGVELSLDGNELTATSTLVLTDDSSDRQPAASYVRTLVFHRTTTNPGIDHPRVLLGGVYTDDLP